MTIDDRRTSQTWALIPLVMFALASALVVVDCSRLPARADDGHSEAVAEDLGDGTGVARRRTTPLELRVAYDLARYAANEAGLGGWADAVLLWQSAETHGETLEARHGWLRSHSRCVVAPIPAQDCERLWARGLTPLGQRPAAWPARASWVRGRAMWFGLLAWCIRVVTGEIEWRPCDGRPQTWDGQRWRESAIARGYTPLDCRDPATGQPLRNEGYRFPVAGVRR